MNTTILLILSLVCALGLGAQTGIDEVVNRIEQNSISLSALRQHLTAEKTATRIGLYPDNPELELGFLQGEPAQLGRKTNFSIRQSFDFPLAYIHRNRLAQKQRQNLDWQYQSQRLALRLEARLLAIDLVHANAQIAEQTQRLDLVRDLAEAYRRRFDQGDANILELNKAKMAMLEIGAELEQITIERQAILSELTCLNGGQKLDFTDTRFDASVPIPSDFTAWYAGLESQIPELRVLSGENSVLESRLSLEGSLGLPKITLGYMSEAVGGEKFSGVTAGLNIPLFERKNVVRSAREQAQAGRAMEMEVRRQHRARMQSLHDQATAQLASIGVYRQLLAEVDHAPLLKKALEAGEITVIEYVNELRDLFEKRIHLLQLQRDQNRTMARLDRYRSVSLSR
jgi:outer membrane protein TolC